MDPLHLALKDFDAIYSRDLIMDIIKRRDSAISIFCGQSVFLIVLNEVPESCPLIICPELNHDSKMDAIPCTIL